jgi:hypothetical protein
LKVPVYDYAGVEEASLPQAASEARRIFAGTGVKLELIFCPMRVADIGSEYSCLPDPEARKVTLAILPPEMARRLARPDTEMGRSMGDHAQIFLDRIESFAGGNRRLRDQLLGHVLAHELGHLVLGPGHHSPAGIMSSLFGIRETAQLRQGTLLFHAAEAKRIREWVLAQALDERLEVSGLGHAEVHPMVEPEAAGRPPQR